MKKNTKIWVGIGAFMLAGGGSVAPFPSSATTAQVSGHVGAPAPASIKHDLLSSAASIVVAQAQGGEGEGGEGEGGEGGEAGINVAATESDPVEYNIALQVIAAHYYAGFAAYEAKETEAGAQMFAHGLGEVYIGMEDVFKKRGVTDLGAKLQAAVDVAAANKPVPEVRRRVDAVLKSLRAAEKKAPKSSQSPLEVKSRVVVNLLGRAAAQYQASLDDKALEPYLDGLGFSIAARKDAANVMPQLRRADKKKAAAVKRALDLAAAAYPGIKRPAKKPEPATFLSAASAAQLAVSNW